MILEAAARFRRTVRFSGNAKCKNLLSQKESIFLTEAYKITKAAWHGATPLFAWGFGCRETACEEEFCQSLKKFERFSKCY